MSTMPHQEIDREDGRSLRSGFLEHAAASPERPALILGDAIRSYGEIERAACTWAAAIVRAAGGPAERVGVFAYRSEAAYTGVLAALCSGAAYVPLNPTFPPDRTRSMIRQAQLDAIIVDRKCAAQLGEVLAGLDRVPPLILPEHDAAELPADVRVAFDKAALAAVSPLRELPPVLPESVAYLLFTSGSTGEPKGVPVTHGNVLYFLDFVQRRYRFRPDDRFSQTFDQTFDLSVFDMFAAWGVGASVCVMQSLDLLAPIRFVNRHQVTVWFSVPSVPALLRKRDLLKPGAMPSLRWSLFCGEPLPRASAEAWQAAAPDSIVENLYGPTELTISCFLYRWQGETSVSDCVNDLVPIGRPFSGLGAVVVNDRLEPVAPGADGELCVCGPQTVPGYWRSPEKTAERFVSLPLAGSLSARFYRTGDRVRRLTNGDYVYLGRTDHQVKVLGHRVELGEIEAVLGRFPGIAQAVAMGWPVKEGTAEGIVAFVTGVEIPVDRLVASCRESLPDYMVPKQVFVLDKMPLNANGKIDRKTLGQSLAAEPAALRSA